MPAAHNQRLLAGDWQNQYAWGSRLSHHRELRGYGEICSCAGCALCALPRYHGVALVLLWLCSACAMPVLFSPAATAVIVMSRWGGVGSQRLPLGFSGDQTTAWPTLGFQVTSTPTAANVLFNSWSHDIGGFDCCGGEQGGIYGKCPFPKWQGCETNSSTDTGSQVHKKSLPVPTYVCVCASMNAAFLKSPETAAHFQVKTLLVLAAAGALAAARRTVGRGPHALRRVQPRVLDVP